HPQSQRPPRYSGALRREGGRQKSTKSRAAASACVASVKRRGSGSGSWWMRARRRAAKSTGITLLRAGCNVARTVPAGGGAVTGCGGRPSVAAVAIVGLEREMLEESLLGLARRDGTQHLLRLLGERNGRHHARQLRHGQPLDGCLHLVEHRPR